MSEISCFSCANGTIRPAVINYEVILGDGKPSFVIPDLSCEVCDNCGERLFDHAACSRIDDEIDRRYPDWFKRK